jgi:alkanesulfonate monooxygenase SsuD/methylene tetrahydromethanopterin reductase-like flavin-dependent oxidoreductase (luciferase family)
VFQIGLIDHVEGSREDASGQVYRQVAELIQLADQLGVRYGFFAEHHGYAHEGHLPEPLLMALHLAGKTQQILLGTAIICLNLHNPLQIAEQIAVADTLAHRRLAPGFGSGSTDEEFRLFGLEPTAEKQRHAQFESALQSIQDAWRDERFLPKVADDLMQRSWLAVNSVGSAQIAGRLGFNMLFSHLRTVGQYREFERAYREAGGKGLIAANRPVFVAKDDATAAEQAEPALRRLWRQFQKDGKIPATVSEPTEIEGLCGHPINFIVGGPATVARKIRELRQEFAFDVLNVEVRWQGLAHDVVLESLRMLMVETMEILNSDG